MEWLRVPGRRDYRTAGVGRPPDRERGDGRGDVVDADDAPRRAAPRAARRRRWRPRAGRARPACVRPAGRVEPVTAPASTCATSRPAAARRARAARAGARSSARLCAGVLPKPMPGSRTMRSRAMPARGRGVDRARAGTRRPRRRRRRSRAGSASSAACRACASGRRRSSGARRRPRARPALRSAAMSLTMSAPRSSAARMTSGLVVSIEIGQPRPTAAAQHRQHAREFVLGAHRHARRAGSTRRRCRGCRRPPSAAARSGRSPRAGVMSGRRRRTSRA